MSAFGGIADIAREDDQLIVSCELCGLAKNFQGPEEGAAQHYLMSGPIPLPQQTSLS